jgi:hypothetical protein
MVRRRAVDIYKLYGASIGDSAWSLVSWSKTCYGWVWLLGQTEWDTNWNRTGTKDTVLWVGISDEETMGFGYRALEIECILVPGMVGWGDHWSDGKGL